MFNFFMWFLLLAVLCAIIGFVFLLYKIIKEQKDIDAHYKDIDEEEKRKQKKSRSKVSIIDKLNNNNFDSILEEAKKNPEDLEDLKHGIQNILRKYIKTGDCNKARTCNEQLRKIDAIQKEGN